MSDIANSGDQPTTAGDATPTDVTSHADVQAGPARPVRTLFPGDDPKREKLVQNVKDAMLALPIYFRTSTSIEGLEAGDLFSLNSVLGGTIEVQTVATLNRIREVWDPDDEWTEYGFERSSQSFPDVRLVSRSADKPHTVLGIELKGWYLLSKEGEPSFRYTATRSASSEYDLIAVVPWRLSNVLSGVPVVYEPFIEQAMYAADLRNYYWEHDRGAKGDTRVTSPKDVHPYPASKSEISDKANSDSGGNFGRVARVSGLMDDYCARLLETQVAGIGAKHWARFFKTYSDGAAKDRVDELVARAFHKVQKPKDEERTEQLVANLSQLRKLLSGEPTE